MRDESSRGQAISIVQEQTEMSVQEIEEAKEKRRSTMRVQLAKRDKDGLFKVNLEMAAEERMHFIEYLLAYRAKERSQRGLKVPKDKTRQLKKVPIRKIQRESGLQLMSNQGKRLEAQPREKLSTQNNRTIRNSRLLELIPKSTLHPFKKEGRDFLSDSSDSEELKKL